MGLESKKKLGRFILLSPLPYPMFWTFLKFCFLILYKRYKIQEIQEIKDTRDTRDKRYKRYKRLNFIAKRRIVTAGETRLLLFVLRRKMSEKVS